ncbi:hypothetical protein JHK84_043598 [Glycine max]|nr:hypothetical protein JHK84_043598 [Glycine max]
MFELGGLSTEEAGLVGPEGFAAAGVVVGASDPIAVAAATHEPPKHCILNSLKEASKDLHTTTNPFSFHSKIGSHATIHTLLDLEAKAYATLSSGP